MFSQSELVAGGMKLTSIRASFILDGKLFKSLGMRQKNSFENNKVVMKLEQKKRRSCNSSVIHREVNVQFTLASSSASSERHLKDIILAVSK